MSEGEPPDSSSARAKEKRLWQEIGLTKIADVRWLQCLERQRARVFAFSPCRPAIALMSNTAAEEVEYCSRGICEARRGMRTASRRLYRRCQARNTSIHCRTSGEGWPKTLQLDPADQRRQKVTSHRTPNATQQMSSAVRRYARSHAYFADPACGVRTPAGQARCEVACADGPPYLL